MARKNGAISGLYGSQNDTWGRKRRPSGPSKPLGPRQGTTPMQRVKSPISTPGWVVSGTEVDEEVPSPARYLQQVLHTPQIHPEKAGPTPDGDHSPGCHLHIIIPLSQLHHLTVQIVGALWETGYSPDAAGPQSYNFPAQDRVQITETGRTLASVLHHSGPRFPYL
jgi:hypothetical protein